MPSSAGWTTRSVATTTRSSPSTHAGIDRSRPNMACSIAPAGRVHTHERRPREPGGSRRCTRSQCKAGWPRGICGFGSSCIATGDGAENPFSRVYDARHSAATSPTSSARAGRVLHAVPALRADACSGGTAGLTAADLTLRRVTACSSSCSSSTGRRCLLRTSTPRRSKSPSEAGRRRAPTRRDVDERQRAGRVVNVHAPRRNNPTPTPRPTTQFQPRDDNVHRAESAGEANHRRPRTDEAVHSAFDPRIAPSRSRRSADNEDDRVLLGSWL